MKRSLKTQISLYSMCEFTVIRKSGPKTEKIGEDVIFFQYNEQGNSRLADILGRSKISAPNALVYEINMLENRHDITLIESDIVPFFVKFVSSLQSNNTNEKTQCAKQLIAEIQKHIE